ncbi:MAG: BglII/BstYI family type II restriction endonuclease [Candidatus Methylomirabilales bacterium]
MRIVQQYSHLNGLEFLEARKPALWKEICRVIQKVDAKQCRTKVSKEARMLGKLLYSPSAMNTAMEEGFRKCRPSWKSVQTNYWVCADARTNRKIIDLPFDDQKEKILEAGFEPIQTYNQTDFVKDRVAVEVQFGKYSFVAYDLFVKHLAFYVADTIDVGVEILPMKSLQAEMSSGPSYYEKELHNLIREGRGVPGVPLVVLGVAP